MPMTGQLRRPGKVVRSLHLACVGFLTLLAISLSREKGTGGGAEAVNGRVSSVVDMSFGPSVSRSCNPVNGEDAAIGGAARGIRRLRRYRDGLFVKLCRSFVSRDIRIVLSMAIGELSISVVMVLDCLFGVLWMDESAIPNKLGIVCVPCCC